MNMNKIFESRHLDDYCVISKQNLTNLKASSSLAPSFAALAERRTFTPTIMSLFWFMHSMHNLELTWFSESHSPPLTVK